MKSIFQSNRLTDRLIALFDKLFIRQTGSEKFRIMANKRSSEVTKKKSLKISQSHW